MTHSTNLLNGGALIVSRSKANAMPYIRDAFQLDFRETELNDSGIMSQSMRRPGLFAAELVVKRSHSAVVLGQPRCNAKAVHRSRQRHTNCV